MTTEELIELAAKTKKMTPQEREKYERIISDVQTQASAKMIKLKNEIRFTPEQEAEKIAAVERWKNRQKTKTHEEHYTELDPNGQIIQKSNDTRR